MISHHLRLANPDAPISLIVRLANRFPSTFKYPSGKEEGQSIKLTVTRNGHIHTSERFDQEIYQTRQTIDAAAAAEADPDAPYGTIKSLVVCLKAPTTLSALSQLKHRIAPNSVIALLQNGMGVYDELCEKVWPEPATRPFFLLGTTTHGVTPSKRHGEVIHMSREGEGNIKWGLAPDPRQEVDLERWVWGKRVSDTPILTPPDSPTLPIPPIPQTPTDLSNVHTTLSALLSLSELDSTLLPMPHIHHTLLLKLALNANINPLTAILGAGSLPNGSLVGSSPSRRLIKMLSGETSSIITAYLNQLHAPHSPPPDVLRLYTRDSLVSRTLALCSATARNSSSMAVDASAGRLTEIDYINGYLVSLADRLNIPTPHHQMVREMVKFTTEATGLQNETGRKPLRVARKQNSIKQMNVVNVETQKLYLEDKKREIEEKKLKEAERERIRAARRTHKAGRKASSTAFGMLKPSSNVPPVRRRGSGSGLISTDPEDGSIDPSEGEVGPDSDRRSATLAHLDELVDRGRTGQAPQAIKGSSAPTPTTPKEDQPETDEQGEAMKAIESRIFSRSGRSGF